MQELKFLLESINSQLLFQLVKWDCILNIKVYFCKILKKLASLEGDMPLYAGHEEETTLEKERKTNPFLLDA